MRPFYFYCWIDLLKSQSKCRIDSMHSKNTHQFTQLLKHLDFTDTQRSLDNIAKLEEDVEEDNPYELDLSDYGFITIFGLILIIGLIYCAINF